MGSMMMLMTKVIDKASSLQSPASDESLRMPKSVPFSLRNSTSARNPCPSRSMEATTVREASGRNGS
jgi:hypothetical protein